ncbi:MAG: hypothetical protein ACREBD_40670, partial [Blastocatellia bacterium]
IIVLSAMVWAQGVSEAEPDELYAGIEVSHEGVKAAAIRVGGGEAGESVRLVYSETIKAPLLPGPDGKLPPEAIKEAARAARKLQTRLQQEYHVQPDRIYLIGRINSGGSQPEGLVKEIKQQTGQPLSFLTADNEAQLSIVGVIPQRSKAGDAWVDVRGSSVWIEIGNGDTRGGYQLYKKSPSAKPTFDLVTMNIPYGTGIFAREVNRQIGESKDRQNFIRRAQKLSATSLSQALKKERERKPGLVYRKQVFLTGAIVWALATLLYPEDRQMFIPLTVDDIAFLAEKAARDQDLLLNPDLSRIRDQRLRSEIERELESVRDAFTPEQLIAGSELLKAVATEFDWQGKKVWFARHGHLGCLLSYIRLQAEK